MRNKQILFNRTAKTNRSSRSNRGSVILMVIGLLTIIEMLGTSFLLISRLDRKQSEAIAAKAAADPIAEGILAQLVATLKDDLYIDADGPYGNVGTGTPPLDEQLRRFIDYPSENPGNDSWLASTWVTGATLGHVSNINSPPAPAAYENRLKVELVDTDGDEPDPSTGAGGDALLYPTGITNSKGQEYYAAVRVVDLSGLININIAWAADQTGINDNPVYVAPVLINLRDFINFDGSERFVGSDRLNYVRGDGFEHTPRDINDNIALRFFDPTNNCKPFAIGDEMFLRWLADNAQTDTGRLEASLNDGNVLPASFRRSLTTFNCSRTLVRRPAAATTVIPLAPAWKRRVNLQLDSSGKTALDDPAVAGDPDPKQALFEALANAIGGASPLEPKKKAAHFVANLWAYLDGMKANESYSFTFTLGGMTYTAYGLVPQPVIAEAYAYNLIDSGLEATLPANNDEGWAFAIELYNPTSVPIDLTNYKLVQGANTFTFPAGTTLATSERLVIYTLNGSVDIGAGRQPTSITAFGFHMIPLLNRLEWVDLDFFDSEPVYLVRTPGGVDIRVDKVAKADFGYDADDKQTSPTECKSGLRDDHSGRKRVFVAKMKSFDLGAAGLNDITAHMLGGTNDLPETALTAADPPEVYQGFGIRVKGANVVTLGELLDIYITGPGNENAPPGVSFPQNLAANYANKISRGRSNVLGTPIVMGLNYPPNIPLATVLGEFFEVVPPDRTREDESLGEHSRIYGKININTATKDVLMRLPFPDEVNNIKIGDYGGTDSVASLARRNEIVDGIIAYRQAISGFLTPGQIAIPMASYARTNLMGTTPLTPENAGYLAVLDGLYRSIANVITVNSDVYTVYIRVQIGGGASPRYKWNYLAVIDRSNCRTEDDTPAVLLFSQVK